MFTDNQIPTGNRRLEIVRGSGGESQVGSFITESVNIRNDAGDAVLQILTLDSPRPQAGDWFWEQDFIPGDRAKRRWVITQTSQPYNVAGYLQLSMAFGLAHNRNGLNA